MLPSPLLSNEKSPTEYNPPLNLRKSEEEGKFSKINPEDKKTPALLLAMKIGFWAIASLATFGCATHFRNRVIEIGNELHNRIWKSKSPSKEVVIPKTCSTQNEDKRVNKASEKVLSNSPTNLTTSSDQNKAAKESSSNTTLPKESSQSSERARSSTPPVSHPTPSTHPKKHLYSPDRIVQVFKGSQAGCDGDVTVRKCNEIFHKIVSKQPKTISFNEGKIAEEVKGGTCSAMAFDFAERYLEIRENPELNSQGNNTLLNRVSKLGEDFKKSSLERRTEQAAFNTIEVKKGVKQADYSRDKMQAILNYHDLKMDYSSKEISPNDLNNNKLENELNSLPNGTYILRVIDPSNNEKLETQGHSAVFIKENNLGIYYDPNHGAKAFPYEKSTDVISSSLEEMADFFHVTHARFYRVSKENTPLSFAQRKEIALIQVKQNDYSFDLPEDLRKDRDVALAAVKHAGYALIHFSEELRNDKEIALAAVKQDGYALGVVGEKLLGDRDVVLAAVKNAGYALAHASEDLRKDKEIALAAVKNDNDSFQFISERLKDDEDILAIINKNPHTRAYAMAKLRKQWGTSNNKQWGTSNNKHNLSSHITFLKKEEVNYNPSTLCSKETPEAVASDQMFYHERQSRGQCSVHATNAFAGGIVITPDLMQKANIDRMNELVREMGLPSMGLNSLVGAGIIESRDAGIDAGVVKLALEKIYVDNNIESIEDSAVNILQHQAVLLDPKSNRDRVILGLNGINGHFVTVRKDKNNNWRLIDSMANTQPSFESLKDAISHAIRRHGVQEGRITMLYLS